MKRKRPKDRQLEIQIEVQHATIVRLLAEKESLLEKNKNLVEQNNGLIEENLSMFAEIENQRLNPNVHKLRL